MLEKLPEINQEIINNLISQGANTIPGTFSTVYKYEVSEQECYSIKVYKKNADWNTIENKALIMEKLMQNQPPIDGIIKFFGKNQIKMQHRKTNYDTTVFFLEQCDGSLESLIDSSTKFTEEQVLEFLNQVTGTLIQLFDKQIFHRNVKPKNILYTMDANNKYQFKFADFGEGQFKEKLQINEQKPIKEAEIYVAPELRFDWEAGKANPFKSDIFSLGITLLQMIFGKNISFPSLVNPIEIKKKFTTELAKQLQLLDKRFDQSKNSESWKEIITKMLDFDTEQRLDPISLLQLLKEKSLSRLTNDEVEKIITKFNQDPMYNLKNEQIKIQNSAKEQLFNNVYETYQFTTINLTDNAVLIFDFSNEKDLIDKEFLIVLHFLKQNATKIKELQLLFPENDNLTDIAFGQLGKLLEQFVNMNKLVLNFNKNINFTDLSFAQFNNSMKQLRKLTDLELYFGSNINFSNKILISLTKVIKLYHNQLNRLNLTFNQNQKFQSSALISFASALEHQTYLTALELNFSGNDKFDDAGFNALAQKLKLLPILKYLNINFASALNITDVSFREFAKALKHLIELDNLTLNFNNVQKITSQSLIELSHSLECLNKITSLILQFNQNYFFNDDGIISLISSLKQMVQLKSLSFYFTSNQQFTGNLLSEFGQTLEVLINLEELHINFGGNYQFTDEHFLNFGKSIAYLKKLKALTLNFYYNLNFTNKSIISLISSMNGLMSLKLINLDFNYNSKVNDTTLEAFNNLVNGKKELEILKLNFAGSTLFSKNEIVKFRTECSKFKEVKILFHESYQ